MWRAWSRKPWRSLSQLRFGVILLALLLGAVVLGTLFPQLPQQADKATWWEAVRNRYGALHGPLQALGLFNFSEALWFKSLLGLLLLTTLACFLNRVWPLSRVVFRPRTRISAERFDRAGMRAQLTFPSADAAESALTEALRQRRYRVQIERRAPTEARSHFELFVRADRHRLTRLGTLLTHVGLLVLLMGAACSGLLSWRVPALTITSGQVTPVGNGTSVGLRCDQFRILHYDDGTPQDYRAQITLIAENGDELRQGTIRINHPLKYAGVNYYLQSLHLPALPASLGDETETCEVTVNAVHDPGYGLSIFAGLVLLIGVTLTFHFPHRRLWARTAPTGDTALVGSTAWDRERFSRQFDALVAELREADVSGDDAPNAK
jgi:cytochrome c biogenesis protein ResB